MNVLHPEWRARLDLWKRTLTEDFYQPLGEISWEAFRTMDHLLHTEVITKPFEPVQPGFTWGKSWEYCWFKGRITLPPSAKGKRIVMNLGPNGESTLFVNGKTFGAYRKKAPWPPVLPWEFYEDNVLTECAEGGETFDILMETYAGHYVPDRVGPVLDESLIRETLPEGARLTLGQSTFGVFNMDAYHLYLDVDTLDRLYGTLDNVSLRAMKIGKGLRRFTQIVDFEQPAEQRNRSYREAREMLRPLMEAKNGSTMPQCYAIGQSHLDLAWLWPFEETHRKTARTFAAQLRLMEQYPDYKFMMSQPASYEMCRKYYPDTFEGIKAAVARGQWIPEGALWVEPDLNLAGGEALIRQFLYGKQYYKKEFGTDSEILWAPDTFGYTATLPQIMKGCGVKYFLTQKLFWTYNDWDKFPYHYFTWQGIDGSQVTSLFTTFNLTYPDDAAVVWKDVHQPDVDCFLVPYGYGDGGGGPTMDQIEFALRQQDLEGAAPMKLASPNEMFHHLDDQGGPENTYVGELYLCVHRGTLTTQARIKKNNRRAELTLREMELWSTIAQAKGMDYDADKTEELWKELLLNQFHDILPGSSITRVNEHTHKAVDGIIAQSAALAAKARSYLTCSQADGAVTLFNSLSFPRTELVVLPETFAGGAVTADGVPVPVQKTPCGIQALVTVPSCGAVSLIPAQTAAAEQPAVTVTREAEGFRLENSRICAMVNSRGEVVSYIRKDSGREFAGGTMNRFRLYKDVPRDCDAWDIDSHYLQTEAGGAENITVTMVSEGLEAVLKVTGTISQSSYTQYIRLAADSDVLLFDTEMDWREMHKLLKVDFTSSVYTENAINEIQCGYIERPTHRSRIHDQDRFEVCNHRYSALQDGSHGAAVMNDCKYGISMLGSTLSLTLLRAAIQPELRADNGQHSFTYAFTGWNGSFVDSPVTQKAYALNAPLQLAEGTLDTFSALSVDQDNILLDTMKPAEDRSGDIILRFYESKKAPVTAAIHTALAQGRKAYVCDMLENIIEEIPVTDGTFRIPFHTFEIKTIRLR